MSFITVIRLVADRTAASWSAMDSLVLLLCLGVDTVLPSSSKVVGLFLLVPCKCCEYIALQRCFEFFQTFSLRDVSMPLIAMHSTGIDTMPPDPERSASCALRLSPFVHVKNLEDIVRFTYYARLNIEEEKVNNSTARA